MSNDETRLWLIQQNKKIKISFSIALHNYTSTASQMKWLACILCGFSMFSIFVWVLTVCSRDTKVQCVCGGWWWWIKNKRDSQW